MEKQEALKYFPQVQSFAISTYSLFFHMWHTQKTLSECNGSVFAFLIFFNMDNLRVTAYDHLLERDINRGSLRDQFVVW